MVTGPPAVGKTTLARMLAGRRTPSVHLHSDDFWQFIVNGYIEPWLVPSQTQNEVVMRAVCGAAADFALGGYSVVLDGVLGPWFLHVLADRCPPDRFVVNYVVLLPPLEDVLARLVGRTGHGFTSGTATTKMHQEFAAGVAGFERHVLDTHGLSPEASLDVVESAAAEGTLRLLAR